MLKPHLQYLSYVIRHKWYVLKECFSYGLFWRGVKHDWSKFLPSEWFPYVHHFYGSENRAEKIKRDETGYYKPTGVSKVFDRAWLHHIHYNDHHWQHWLLVQDEDEDKILQMPTNALWEMVCDWRGAGRAQGHSDIIPWYKKHKEKMQLHPLSREFVELLIGIQE